jgi:hypothetical protein
MPADETFEGDVFVVVSKFGYWSGNGFVPDWREARHFSDYDRCHAAVNRLAQDGVVAVPRYVLEVRRPLVDADGAVEA